jgi:hypothetical protein
MTSIHEKRNDEALAEAFRTLVDLVASMRGAGVPLSQVQHAPLFSYLLTPRQFDRIKRICRSNGWQEPNCRGVLIDLNAVDHPLSARNDKDGCTAEILLHAYSAYSQIGQNKPKYSQGLVFNTGRKVRVGGADFYAVAVVQVETDGARKYLAPVTAYHATEAKIRGIR